MLPQYAYPTLDVYTAGFPQIFEWWKDCYHCLVDQYCFKAPNILFTEFFFIIPGRFSFFSLKKVRYYATDYSDNGYV